jgi:hypothetical protein
MPLAQASFAGLLCPLYEMDSSSDRIIEEEFSRQT